MDKYKSYCDYDDLSVGGKNTDKAKNGKRRVLLQMIAISLASSIFGATLVGTYFTLAAPQTGQAEKGYTSSYGQQADSGRQGASGQDGSGAFTEVSMVDSTSAVSVIAEKVGPSVVGIRTAAVSRGTFGLQRGGGEGSGIIYSQDGYIVTNYHVIENAVDTSSRKISSGSKIEAVLPNQVDKPYEAQLVGYDSKTDLAVLKIQASNLPAAELGNSDELKVGETAVAIGNPGGLEYMGSVTSGIISGLNRTIEADNGTQMKLIQTDVAINPGNSGGALLNSRGQVIGINSIKIVAQGYEGLGFAIPSNKVREIVDSLINYKYVKGRTLLGISVDQRYNEQAALQNNLPEGVYVQDVALFSGAYKAGIKAGDIITKFDGKDVKSYSELDNLKSSHKPGDVVTLEIYRDGEVINTEVIFDEDQGN